MTALNFPEVLTANALGARGAFALMALVVLVALLAVVAAVGVVWRLITELLVGWWAGVKAVVLLVALFLLLVFLAVAPERTSAAAPASPLPVGESADRAGDLERPPQLSAPVG